MPTEGWWVSGAPTSVPWDPSKTIQDPSPAQLVEQ